MKQRSKVRRSTADKLASQPSASSRASAANSPWTSPAAPLESLPRAAAILFVLAACLVCLGYTLYTNQTWEDSLITLRHSENLLKGEGLTFNTGSRVHGFTSPINVLLLAICHFVTGQTSYVATFWLYRIITIAAFAASGVLLLKAIYETPPRWSAALWFLGVVYIFDVKTIAFSINGMETAFVLFFLAWGVYLMSRTAPEQWHLRGLCWAGLMWSRPDGFVYIGALCLAEFIFLAVSRRATLISLVRSAAVCLAVYAPWIIWAWIYYGSPIPHTIIAKANIEQGTLTQLFAASDNYLASLISQSAQVFRPIYYGDSPVWFGPFGWGRLTNGLTKLVALVALFYFIYPVQDRFGRAMSLCFAVVCSYFTYMTVVYPWYCPPAALLGVVAFTRAATAAALTTRVHASANRELWRRKAFVATSLVFLAGGAIFLFMPAALKERVQQAEIEMGNRAEIGKWLKENAKPGETVYLEPLGYIGYFSGLHIDDFPGLVSPEIVRLRHQLPRDPQILRTTRFHLIPRINADWVVLRFVEYNQLSQLPFFEEFKRNYTLVREFDVNNRLNKYPFLPGNYSLRYDAGFVVFHRNSPAK